MYVDYNDQELLYLICDSNEDAMDILYNKYKNIIDIKVSKYKLLGKRVGLEYNDLFQEGMVGLSEAIKNYKDNKDTKFASFANMCIERQILNVISSQQRKKHFYLNDSCSLDVNLDGDGRTLLDFVLDDTFDPSVMIEDNEAKEVLYNSLYKELSDLERNVFDLKVLGLEYREIASILDKSYKSIDSALQRIRVKLRKVLDEYHNS